MEASDRRPPDTTRDGGGGNSGEEVFSLLRYSHIFASVVREFLELKVLREVSPAPLTLSQFHLLKLVSDNGTHQVGEVAEFLGLSPPAATKNIDKLESLDLVRRSQSRGDRRATFLLAAPKGRKLVDAYEQLKVARLAPILDSFQREELEQLASLLERFSVALLAGDESNGFCLRCAAYVASSCPVSRVRGGCPYLKARSAHGAGAGAGGVG